MTAKIKSLLFLLVVLCMFLSAREKPFEDTVCLNKDELKLYDLIMNYRKQKKLSKIPLSKSLTLVAQTHVRDLAENQLVKGNCNGHSWSDKGKWSSCCYTPDHAKAQCMWDKPRELSSYPADGFEIVYYTSATVKPEDALLSWQKSKGHNMVMVNLSTWKNVQWNAIGIGIYKGYACVWFGAEKDAAGEPARCLH